jgi:hypothetical protein
MATVNVTRAGTPVFSSAERGRQQPKASHVYERVIMTSPERSMAFSEELAQTYLAHRDRGFEELEQALLKLEAVRTASVEEPEAREIRRRVAEELLMGAYLRNADWSQFSRPLARIQALGYSNLERQVHVACLFARWAHRRREHEEEAIALLDHAASQVALGSDLQIAIRRTRSDTGKH